MRHRPKRSRGHGVFARIMMGLAAGRAESRTIMIDATCLKVHRTASSLCAKKGGRRRQIGRTRGGMNTRLQAVTDAKGRPIRFFRSAGQVSDCTGTAVLPGCLPRPSGCSRTGHDADWLREAIANKGTRFASPAGRSAKRPENETSGAPSGATASRSCSAT